MPGKKAKPRVPRGTHRKVEELVQKYSAPAPREDGTPFPTRLFGGYSLNPESAGVVSAVIDNVPPIARTPLPQQAIKMRGRMRNFLKLLGRPPDESGIAITGIDLAALNDDKVFEMGEFSLTGAEIKRLCQQAKITFVKDKVKPEEIITDQIDEGSVHSDSQFIAVSGPVYICFDNNLAVQPRPKASVLTVSIPGINFAYSPADQEKFTVDDWNEDRTKKRRVVKQQAALLRMKQIYAHSFTVMQQSGVHYPCLSAIGCGAFKGPFADVPGLWARALFEVLSEHDYGFRAVFDSLPTFGEDNFTEFSNVFALLEGQGKQLKTAVVLLEDRSMVAIANHLAQANHNAGILNPSDVQAIRQGRIGMFWDGGHVALEEILAMQTTLLLQHRGVNPALFSEPKRRVPIDLPLWAESSAATRSV
eukprot:TRINITY_DN33366_c0_g1_i1.p1 TRINITY_DN33366_c0_g1~~TRINITY_DN33366_c0_g1_i1.p1  ORF type:complete len:419 (-),score=82.28 TRINITY_DN33366_c0_g1_i1:7-1263(-)